MFNRPGRLNWVAAACAALLACGPDGELAMSDGALVDDDASSIDSSLSTPVPIGSTLRTTAHLNLRPQPTTRIARIDVLPYGATVETVEQEAPVNGFYRVRAPDGKVGFVFGTYVELVSEGPSAPAPSSPAPSSPAPQAPAPSAPVEPVILDQRWTRDEANRILARARAISERAAREVLTGASRLSQNEYQILFAAAELQTGVPAEVLKAVAFGEGLGVAYPVRDAANGISYQSPNHFIEGDLAPGIAGREDWAWELLQVDLPVALGDDPSVTGSQTYGLGIMQITAPISDLRQALRGVNNGEVMVLGGGKPRWGWTQGTVTFQVMPAMRDPGYNILIGARLMRHKQLIYSDPQRMGGPLPWVKADARTPMDWALIASTYGPAGGYGPGGGATQRYYVRMTDPSSPAYTFVNTRAVP